MAKPQAQLGTLEPGDKFFFIDTGGTLSQWIVTDMDREGETLCVRLTTGEAKWLCNSTETELA